MLAQLLSPSESKIKSDNIFHCICLSSGPNYAVNSGRNVFSWQPAEWMVVFISVLKRPSVPDAPIEPVLTEDAADTQRRQPGHCEPTTGHCSDETDDRPQKKRSGRLDFGLRQRDGVDPSAR